MNEEHVYGSGTCSPKAKTHYLQISTFSIFPVLASVTLILKLKAVSADI